MTTYIEVEKEVTLTSDVDVTVNIGVETVLCGCGKNLDFKLSTDHHGDLEIDVTEHVCEQEETNEN
jgi:hypothetical protein